MRDKNSIVKSDPISFYDMQKVQDRVKKMLGTSHAVTLIGLSFFSFVYFTLLQGPWIFSETKRLAIGNDFAFQKRKSMPNFNTL